MNHERDSCCLDVVPELPVADLAEAQRWFRETLGFRTAWVWEDRFAAVSNGDVQLYLRKEGAAIAAVRCYLHVKDADALHDRCRQRGVRIVAPLESQPWGMREFAVETPDGHLLRIGHGERRIDEIDRFKRGADGEKSGGEMRTDDTFRIRRAGSEPAVAEALADVLLDCVEGGASVGFMLPLPRSRAVAFWQQVLASAGRGERIVLVAEEAATGTIVGTVQVVLATPENQPHRADVAKMQVHRRARRRGLGAALLRAAEAAARAAGRTLLVLDTVTGSDAERLYTRLGWQRCGVIPGYALWPQGGFCDTTVFYRVLADEGAETTC
jgi:GNAT superfamily N-acetyltransferase